MKVLSAALPLIVLGFLGCRSTPPPEWKTGFWFWNGSDASVKASNTVDLLYCHVGSIGPAPMSGDPPQWGAYGSLPDELPPAARYWLVFRLEEPGLPPPRAATPLIARVQELLREARRRELSIAGVQLDIDSPTGKLPQYAAFLRELRKGLAPPLEISITALLDWFRDGTAIGQVLEHVDEFIPQFYDVENSDQRKAGGGIGAPFEAARWDRAFNRHRKRFRIGISTFGRSTFLAGHSDRSAVGYRVAPDARLLDVASNPAFERRESRTPARELVLSFRAAKETQIGWSTFQAGEGLSFSFATPESIQLAVEQARLVKGYCAGVVFFRWPGPDESLGALPDEVLAAAGLLAGRTRNPGELLAADGGCVAVSCADLYLVNAARDSHARIFHIETSTPLQYFVPNEKLPARMASSSRIDFRLPAHTGLVRGYIGRAVSETKTEFKMKMEQER